MNTFFLSPGFAKYTHDYLFKTLHWKHRNLINSIGIKLEPEDLAPADFSRVCKNVEWVERVLRVGPRLLHGHDLARYWGLAIGLKLTDIWMEMLALLKYLGGLKSVKIVTVHQELVAVANDMNPVTNSNRDRYSREIRDMLKSVRRAVARKIE